MLTECQCPGQHSALTPPAPWEPLFGRRGRLEEIYPDIEDFTVEVQEIGPSSSPKYTSLPNEIESRCSNRRCKDGGFRADLLLAQAYAARETSAEGKVDCKGSEGSGRDRSPCMHGARLKVTVRYKAK